MNAPTADLLESGLRSLRCQRRRLLEKNSQEPGPVHADRPLPRGLQFKVMSVCLNRVEMTTCMSPLTGLLKYYFCIRGGRGGGGAWKTSLFWVSANLWHWQMFGMTRTPLQPLPSICNHPWLREPLSNYGRPFLFGIYSGIIGTCVSWVQDGLRPSTGPQRRVGLLS